MTRRFSASHETSFKKYSLANLQVRLPALVVGGGLTALDTATETLAYYPVQVEKILHQFETLAKELGEKAIWNRFDEEEKETLQTFLSHGKALRQERESAQAENRLPLFAPLLQKWGGVNVIYRKKLHDSPAYRLNHEEVSKALEEGIRERNLAIITAFDPADKNRLVVGVQIRLRKIQEFLRPGSRSESQFQEQAIPKVRFTVGVEQRL